MNATRTCQGCGGSETLFVVKADPAFCEPDVVIEAASARATLNAWERRFPGMLPLSVAPLMASCLACQGSGQITERIGAEDALADAETLCLEAYCWALGCPEASFLREARGTATMMREEIEAWPAGGDLPWILASESARAAFRAVPGLRG